jgi:hypothetical protein
MNNIQRADVALLHVLWMTKLQFATHRNAAARHSNPVGGTLLGPDTQVTGFATLPGVRGGLDQLLQPLA